MGNGYKPPKNRFGAACFLTVPLKIINCATLNRHNQGITTQTSERSPIICPSHPLGHGRWPTTPRRPFPLCNASILNLALQAEAGWCVTPTKTCRMSYPRQNGTTTTKRRMSPTSPVATSVTATMDITGWESLSPRRWRPLKQPPTTPSGRRWPPPPLMGATTGTTLVSFLGRRQVLIRPLA